MFRCSLQSDCNHVCFTHQTKLCFRVFCQKMFGYWKFYRRMPHQNFVATITYADAQVDFVRSGTGGFPDRTKYQLGQILPRNRILTLMCSNREEAPDSISNSLLSENSYEVNVDVGWNVWYGKNICAGFTTFLRYRASLVWMWQIRTILRLNKASILVHREGFPAIICTYSSRHFPMCIASYAFH